MKEITIMSGKGGTGKTSVTAAIASLAKNAVYCDNDVDAADLHLILNPHIKETHTFVSGTEAKIDPGSCTACGICADHCRFDAIHEKGSVFEVNPLQCEGCRLCERVCPSSAIAILEKRNNFWYVSDTRFGTLVHAHMGPGEENSGRLVTKVRNRAMEIANETEAEFIINDGPPGIGCAAIASITGTGTVLLVIEPSLSGLHDAMRIADLIDNFEIPTYALINKYDINIKVTEKIEESLKERNIPLLAKIPFDKQMVESMIEGKSIVEFKPESAVSIAIGEVWGQLKKSEKEKTKKEI